MTSTAPTTQNTKATPEKPALREFNNEAEVLAYCKSNGKDGEILKWVIFEGVVYDVAEYLP